MVLKIVNTQVKIGLKRMRNNHLECVLLLRCSPCLGYISKICGQGCLQYFNWVGPPACKTHCYASHTCIQKELDSQVSEICLQKTSHAKWQQCLTQRHVFFWNVLKRNITCVILVTQFNQLLPALYLGKYLQY